jgi:hypothetical protein
MVSSLAEVTNRRCHALVSTCQLEAVSMRRRVIANLCFPSHRSAAERAPMNLG